MPTELFNRNGHRCLLFTKLYDGAGDTAQSNQVLIVDNGAGALIDPGGSLAYGELYLALSRWCSPSGLTALIASHAGPDVITSLDRWTSATQAKIYISAVWERLVPYVCKPGKTTGRIVGIPDAGMRIHLGRHDLIALPAHFLRADGNFQFYDPVSQILFSGDLGSSLLSGKQAAEPVTSLATLLPVMEKFHRRHMVSNKALRLWAEMVSSLKIEMIVPQHGAPLMGDAVPEFIDWVRHLQCGLDLLGPASYIVPD